MNELILAFNANGVRYYLWADRPCASPNAALLDGLGFFHPAAR
jgi:hypothetical protein